MQARRCLALGAALLCGGCSVTLMHKPGSATLAEALSARDAKRYEQSATLLRQALAESLDDETTRRAEAELGALIIRDRAPGNATEAVALLEHAESLGSNRPALFLGHACRDGLGRPVDKTCAIENYTHAAASGSHDALLNLALLKEDAESQASLELLAAEGSDRVYRIGRFFEKHHSPKALGWYERAAAQNHPQALRKLARHWREQNKSKAAHYYQQAVIAGDTKSIQELAELTRPARPQKPAANPSTAWREKGLKLWQGASPNQGIIWLTKAAEAGDTLAMRHLARAYATGIGTTADKAKSAEWLTRAAKAGDAEAQFQLGIASDSEQATRWLKRAKQSGHPLAGGVLRARKDRK